MVAISKQQLEHLLYNDMEFDKNEISYHIIRYVTSAYLEEILYTEILAIVLVNIKTVEDYNKLIKTVLESTRNIGWRIITTYVNEQHHFVFGISTYKDNPNDMIESPTDDYYKLKRLK